MHQASTDILKKSCVFKLFQHRPEGKEAVALLGFLIAALFVLSTLSALLTGSSQAAGAAVMEGAQAAVPFVLSITGGICLWSGVLELLERCGAASALARGLRRPLRRLFPRSAREEEILSALTENLSANLLGLGNAATPAGIRAAKGMAALGRETEDELGLLVVLNTASLQLLPAAVASVRAAAGAAAPFDILPAVWLSSALSVSCGLGAAALFRRLWS